jgi:uncharacterized iron-regulated protein
MRQLPWILIVLLCAGCSTPRLLVFGEQHDQPDQQRQVAATVAELAAQRQLAAVVLEMAERGHDTRALPRDADAARVRESLGWTGWPWEPYSAVVMNAVHAGVPVIGGNLPRVDNRGAMADTTLDGRVSDATREDLAAAVRRGHCGLLPASQEAGMVRIQIARDRSMADAVQAALAGAPPGQQVLLLTGAQHASLGHGVPLHLPPGLALRVVMFGDDTAELSADEHRAAAVTPRPDPCEALRQRLRK